MSNQQVARPKPFISAGFLATRDAPSLVLSRLQEHLVGHPIYVPRGARKRLLALAELNRLQMKAETSGVTTAMEVRRTDPDRWQAVASTTPVLYYVGNVGGLQNKESSPALGKGGGLKET